MGVPEPEVDGFLRGFFWDRAEDAFDAESEELGEAWGVSELDELTALVSLFGFGFFWFFLGWGLLVVFGLMGSWGAGWLAGVWAWVYGGFVTYGWVVWCERFEYERALWREERRLEQRERVEAGVSMLFDALRGSTGEGEGGGKGAGKTYGVRGSGEEFSQGDGCPPEGGEGS